MHLLYIMKQHSSRHRYIAYYLKTYPNFKEQSFGGQFNLSEDICKHICKILIDKNLDEISKHNLSNDDFHTCLAIIFKGFFNVKDYDNARIINNYILANANNDRCILLSAKYRQYHIDNIGKNIIKVGDSSVGDSSVGNFNVSNFNELAKNNFVPNNEIDAILYETFCMMKESKEHKYLNLIENIYKKENDEGSVYSLYTYCLDEKCYCSLDDKNIIMNKIRYYDTKNKTDYESLIEVQLNNEDALVRYWNLSFIESKLNKDIHKKMLHKTIHNVNYFYELFGQTYDNCILNYDVPLNETIKSIFCDTIFMTSYYKSLNHESKALLKMSRTDVNFVLENIKYSHKDDYWERENIIKKVHESDQDAFSEHNDILKNVGLENRQYVEICCVCMDYKIVLKIKKCIHKICVDCRDSIIDNKCPLCRINMIA